MLRKEAFLPCALFYPLCQCLGQIFVAKGIGRSDVRIDGVDGLVSELPELLEQGSIFSRQLREEALSPLAKLAKVVNGLADGRRCGSGRLAFCVLHGSLNSQPSL